MERTRERGRRCERLGWPRASSRQITRVQPRRDRRFRPGPLVLADRSRAPRGDDRLPAGASAQRRRARRARTSSRARGSPRAAGAAERSALRADARESEQKSAAEADGQASDTRHGSISVIISIALLGRTGARPSRLLTALLGVERSMERQAISSPCIRPRSDRRRGPCRRARTPSRRRPSACSWRAA